MKTEITVERDKIYINGEPTYKGKNFHGSSIEGLLFNSRMVQAIFDDECEQTRNHWRYPDTGVWDPQRNTDEFCRALSAYRDCGLLGVTVGLQGGGAIYSPEVYRKYRNSAFTEQGELKPAYCRRMEQILKAADELGMVVIVNYLYFMQSRYFNNEKAIFRAIESAGSWLLTTGYRNIIVDVANEVGPFWKVPGVNPENAHLLIEAARSVTLQGRRLLCGASGVGDSVVPPAQWMKSEDLHFPHGNGCSPDLLRQKIREWKAHPEYQANPKPLIINEDSIFTENLDAAAAEGASWGFYCQGYGSGYKDLMDWTTHPRETRYDDLSGFQTLPVNWSINTPIKKKFFSRLKEITGGSCEQ